MPVSLSVIEYTCVDSSNLFYTHTRKADTKGTHKTAECRAPSAAVNTDVDEEQIKLSVASILSTYL
jgi:hypothetical protein